MKRICEKILLMLIAVIALCGFSFPFLSDMPFNGEINFHELSLTIPRNYIRDSTQSGDDLWIFEQGFYKSCIILSRKNLEEDEKTALENYAAYLRAQGVHSSAATFLERNAVCSSQSDADLSWQEVLFAHNGSLYAVAMRGADEDTFQSLLEGVSIQNP